MTGRAAVLAEFKKPLEIREFPLVPLSEGEVRVKVEAAGVCGSDVHMWLGRDPRCPLPMIPGHEGVGRVHETAGEKKDLLGRVLEPGDLVMWERGIMCGKCYMCVVKKQPALCLVRQTYGISLGCSDPPHFNGNYGEYLHLRAGCHFIRIDGEVDPTVLVQASCSGATSAHAVEEARVRPGDAVVIQGAGPVGLFVLAFAQRSGATQTFVLDMSRAAGRLEIAKEFGATHTLLVDQTSLEERLAFVKDHTGGVGADVVFECTGHPSAFAEGIKHVAPLGRYVTPGVATPEGEVSLSIFEELNRKNARIHGVWVSDTSHLMQALRLVRNSGYPFEKTVDHRCSLREATTALELMRDRKIMKAVIRPGEN